MKEIYLAGGCYWSVQKYCDSIRGVHETEVGFANGFVPAPSYEQVKHSQTGHAETVRVCYDETVLPLDCLLRLFFRMIDPTELDRQGNDVGHQYRTGVYWRDAEDEATVRAELAKLAEGCSAPVVVEAQMLRCFYPAEDEHQKYLDQHPQGYCHVPLAMITWVKGIDPRAY